MADDQLMALLRSGRSIPMMGFGTGRLRGAPAVQAIESAISAGYRLFDTASSYGNEREVGEALRASGIHREELVVVSKLRGRDQGSLAVVRSALLRSLDALGLEYLDSYLIHWPLPRLGKYIESWEALLSLADENLIRVPGVSNFTLSHLAAITEATGVPPELNQIQSSPSVSKSPSIAAMTALGVVAQAYSPLENGSGLLRSRTIREIAADVGGTPAQAVLRWHIDRGVPTVAHSSSASRQRENLESRSVQLTREHHERIRALDHDERYATDPDEYYEL